MEAVWLRPSPVSQLEREAMRPNSDSFTIVERAESAISISVALKRPQYALIGFVLECLNQPLVAIVFSHKSSHFFQRGHNEAQSKSRGSITGPRSEPTIMSTPCA
jgi:hypothetical protein